MATRTARNAVLVVGLLTVFFLLMSFQVNRGAMLVGARGTVLGLVSPVQRLISSVVYGIGATWRGYVGSIGAAREAEELAGEVAALRRELARTEAIRRENERLRTALGLTDESAATWMAARVIGRDITHRYQSVLLDRGSADGVRTDSAVISTDGALVGRIVQVARWTSLVQLLTDGLSGVGARLTTSRASGLVAGNDGPVLNLRYIETLDVVVEGEVVVTSGEDQIYPPDIPIGLVSRSGVGAALPGTPAVPLARDETALFLEIDVEPRVDVLRLESVLILMDPRER